MLHILLLILKIIGILIAVIIGLVLLGVCVVLFVPVRCRVRGSYYGSPQGSAKISWLLHAVSVKIFYPDGEKASVRIIVRILGKRIYDNFRNENSASEHTKDKKKPKEKSGPRKEAGQIDEPKPAVPKPPALHQKPAPEPESSAQPASGPESGQTQEPKTAVRPQGEQVSGPDNISSRTQEQDHTPEAALPQKADGPGEEKGRFSRWIEKIKKKLKALVDIKERIKKKLKALAEKKERFLKKLQNIKDKKDAVMAILFDPKNRPAFLKLKRELFRILRHLKPLRLEGKLYFGFEDPAATGYALGALSLLYPVYEDHVALYPDFEAKKLEGELYIYERIRLSVFVAAALRIILDKDIRRIVRSFKHL